MPEWAGSVTPPLVAKATGIEPVRVTRMGQASGPVNRPWPERPPPGSSGWPAAVLVAVGRVSSSGAPQKPFRPTFGAGRDLRISSPS